MKKNHNQAEASQDAMQAEHDVLQEIHLTDADEARKAFIASEIFNRKY